MVYAFNVLCNKLIEVAIHTNAVSAINKFIPKKFYNKEFSHTRSNKDAHIARVIYHSLVVLN